MGIRISGMMYKPPSLQKAITYYGVASAAPVASGQVSYISQKSDYTYAFFNA
jgi:hypothetical protein